MSHGMFDFLFAPQCFLNRERRQYFFASFFGCEPSVLRRHVYHSAVVVDDLDALELMTLGDSEIIWIMSWSDLDGPGTKRPIDVVVGNNGDFSTDQG